MLFITIISRNGKGIGSDTVNKWLLLKELSVDSLKPTNFVKWSSPDNNASSTEGEVGLRTINLSIFGLPPQ